MRVYPITVQPKPDRTPDADQNRALSNDTMNRESGAQSHLRYHSSPIRICLQCGTGRIRLSKTGRPPPPD